jgi:excisionase family DNA binding protein
MRIPKRNIEPLLYTPEQVARLIGFGRSTVYEMIRAGGIPSIRLAGRTRVRREALDAWIESQSKSEQRARG